MKRDVVLRALAWAGLMALLWAVLVMLIIVLTPEPARSRAILDDPTPYPRDIFEPITPPWTPSAATVPVATSRPTPTPTPRPIVALRGSTGLTGTATWYCKPGVSRCTKGYPASGPYAAAGPELRAALGDWRGRWVMVTRLDGSQAVRVKLIDFCACLGAPHRLIDLYNVVFIGEDVEVSW